MDEEDRIQVVVLVKGVWMVWGREEGGALLVDAL